MLCDKESTFIHAPNTELKFSKKAAGNCNIRHFAWCWFKGHRVSCFMMASGIKNIRTNTDTDRILDQEYPHTCCVDTHRTIGVITEHRSTDSLKLWLSKQVLLWHAGLYNLICLLNTSHADLVPDVPLSLNWAEGQTSCIPFWVSSQYNDVERLPSQVKNKWGSWFKSFRAKNRHDDFALVRITIRLLPLAYGNGGFCQLFYNHPRLCMSKQLCSIRNALQCELSLSSSPLSANCGKRHEKIMTTRVKFPYVLLNLSK